MATADIMNSTSAGSFGSVLGTALTELLMTGEITPGSAPSYQLCKTIQAYHPLGKKLTDTPIMMAQSKGRKITVQKGPEERLKEEFEKEWKAIKADDHILNLGRQARTYGISSAAIKELEVPSNQPVEYEKLWDQDITFAVFDPLNTAGSLVLNQDPNSIDFQKVGTISVNGKVYHRSRSVTLLNEDPLYIEYTTSAFGYVGRSVYQRPLYPLKSFIQTMITDDMVSLKAGVIIAKLKQQGSVVNRVMAGVNAIKRAILQEAQVTNVINIGIEEEIESLNLQNLEAPFVAARKNIIQNIATGADMPAIIINSETFAEGFGEGTEDAKYVAQYIDGIRGWLDPAYQFFDRIVQYRAWNPQFYKTIQGLYPEEYADVPYETAFYEWVNSYKAEWPNLLQEPDSELIKVDAVKMQAALDLLTTLAPMLDPDNKAAMIAAVVDNFNALKLIFSTKFEIDLDLLLDYLEEQVANEQDAMMQGAGEDPGGIGKKPSGERRITAGDTAVALLSDRRFDREETRRKRAELRRHLRAA